MVTKKMLDSFENNKNNVEKTALVYEKLRSFLTR